MIHINTNKLRIYIKLRVDMDMEIGPRLLYWLNLEPLRIHSDIAGPRSTRNEKEA